MPYTYVIWSFKHNSWWGPHRAGYVPTLAQAGRYSAEVGGEISTNSVFNENIAIVYEVALENGAPTVKGLWT